MATRVIAVAIDGSENAKFAFDYYVKQVHKAGDKVYLVYGAEMKSLLHSTPWYDAEYPFDKEAFMKVVEEERGKLRHRLEGFGKLLKDAGIDGTVKSVSAHSPGEAICKAADEVGAALVVVGTRGLGKIRRTLMGSVSDFVLHHATMPVLVCRSDK